MRQQTFTRKQVIELVDKILENPDEIIDFLENEDSAWDGEQLIELAEDEQAEISDTFHDEYEN
jgi:hypothetical protein